MSVTIAGAGAFGTALAVSLAAEGGVVRLWARDAAQVREMTHSRQNVRALPGIALPDTIGPVETLNPDPGQTVLVSVPTQKLRGFLGQHGAALSGRVLVLCCKGVELDTGLRPSQVAAELVPDAAVAVLTGPSFASDIARGLPTALTLACADAGLGRKLQAELSTQSLRLYRVTDVTGAELGGALKNVIAIACGIVIGAELGDSARAALMTRGYAEMVRLATALGADPGTLAGLSGFGDLALTCTSLQSRNFSFGHALGRGEAFDPGKTVEGKATARAVTALAEARAIDMPITRMVSAVLEEKLTIDAAVAALLARPLKEED
ncbi:glycerol-3-phosphate dehydrogenase [Maritimibacter sp. 55A14]|uniref:NAD(P)H-dependent glycerol-3-phosphate dehydrogenase n=1 Tax=Maritimibacter sp. 55A14 TaxID=2174844 RepID=UPI000D61A985|nr:NAD(P)H-dependent glycerol-3-phosphate dehydrogenase [Maritimibacter sp. 55A14]PWE28862.1 glycerol-3-phosphate dehydrogenase [Maritimibacter sp. 55A14]